MSTSDKGYKARLAQAERQQRVRDAAPQMLEALIELVMACERWDSAITEIIGRHPDWTSHYLDKARAAIRAAEGD